LNGDRLEALSYVALRLCVAKKGLEFRPASRDGPDRLKTGPAFALLLRRGRHRTI